MVRIHAEKPRNKTVTEIDSAVQDWVSSYSEWAEDHITHVISLSTAPSGTEWVTGDFRFLSSDDKTALLNDAESTLQNEVNWYRLGYHICSHDEQSTTSCGWEDVREWTKNKNTTIPSEVQTFL